MQQSSSLDRNTMRLSRPEPRCIRDIGGGPQGIGKSINPFSRTPISLILIMFLREPGDPGWAAFSIHPLGRGQGRGCTSRRLQSLTASFAKKRRDPRPTWPLPLPLKSIVPISWHLTLALACPSWRNLKKVPTTLSCQADLFTKLSKQNKLQYSITLQPFVYFSFLLLSVFLSVWTCKLLFLWLEDALLNFLHGRVLLTFQFLFRFLLDVLLPVSL